MNYSPAQLYCLPVGLPLGNSARHAILDCGRLHYNMPLFSRLPQAPALPLGRSTIYYWPDQTFTLWYQLGCSCPKLSLPLGYNLLQTCSIFHLITRHGLNHSFTFASGQPYRLSFSPVGNLPLRPRQTLPNYPQPTLSPLGYDVCFSAPYSYFPCSPCLPLGISPTSGSTCQHSTDSAELLFSQPCLLPLGNMLYWDYIGQSLARHYGLNQPAASPLGNAPCTTTLLCSFTHHSFQTPCLWAALHTIPNQGGPSSICPCRPAPAQVSSFLRVHQLWLVGSIERLKKGGE